VVAVLEVAIPVVKLASWTTGFVCFREDHCLP
jgi:hypothetical protein